MTAADYVDWCDFAGLYLGNVSHAERYRTYQAKISAAGSTVVIAHDFLKLNEGGIDLARWRSDIYEMGADAAFRIEHTARALEAIGAPRAAAKVRTVQDTSPLGMLTQHLGNPQALRDMVAQTGLPAMMEDLRSRIARVLPTPPGFPVPEKKPVPPDQEVESWEQVEHLLDKFVRAHEAELLGDLDSYGDVRAEPGFDPEERRRQLGDMRRRELDLERQREQVDKMRQHVERLESQLAKDPKVKLAKVASPRRAIMQCFREYSGRPAAELIPEMRDWLASAAVLQEKYPDIFRPRPTDDKNLLKRLDELGPYRVDVDGNQMTLIWDAPRGLECDWTEFSLALEFPAKKKKPLRLLLDACDRLRNRFAEHQAELRQQVLDNFEIHRPELGRWGLETLELDEAGNITQASIFKNAGGGRIDMRLDEGADDGSVEIAVFFGVEWDDEHGLELCIIDEPDESSSEDANLEWTGLLNHGGPPLTPEDLCAFEERHEVALPADYRTFLLIHNGGQPQPNHFKAKMPGASPLAIDVERFFSILLDDIEDDRDCLDAAVRRHQLKGLPAHYLPIARVLIPGPVQGQQKSQLLLSLAGKQSGKVHVAVHPPQGVLPGGAPGDNPQMAALMAQMYETFCPAIAKSFGAFLAKLEDRPDKKLPEWLSAIRAGDVAAFVNWIAAGGKIAERFTPYGEFMAHSVVDFLSREAAPEFLKDIFDRKIVSPTLVMESWSRLGSSVVRFEKLLPVLPKDQWRRAFSSANIWDEPELLDKVVEARPDLNAGLDGEGATPLHFAVRSHRPDGVRWLLEHGAVPGKPDDFGRTALVWAESERELDCLKLLLEAGESLKNIFPHMPTMKDKLRLIKGRWGGLFEQLADYLRQRGSATAEDLGG